MMMATAIIIIIMTMVMITMAMVAAADYGDCGLVVLGIVPARAESHRLTPTLSMLQCLLRIPGGSSAAKPEAALASSGDSKSQLAKRRVMLHSPNTCDEMSAAQVRKIYIRKGMGVGAFKKAQLEVRVP